MTDLVVEVMDREVSDTDDDFVEEFRAALLTAVT